MSIEHTSKVAVILCTYNPEGYLLEQVKSINDQVGLKADIFIYDDGSDKDSIKVIESVRAIVKDIKFCQPSKSAGKNFIRALHSFRMEDYDYIAFSDQDDIWLEDKLLYATNKLLEQASQGYSSNLTLYDGENKIGYLKKNKRMTELDHHFQGASAGCTYVITKELAESIQNTLNRFDYMNYKEKISHDWLVYYIARVNGFHWYMDECSKILYRQHENNVYGAKRSILKKLSMVFGQWYQDNVSFASNYNDKNNDTFDVNCSFLTKLSYAGKALILRRDMLESVVCYFFWLFKYKNK